jgi:hypothetical protein
VPLRQRQAELAHVKMNWLSPLISSAMLEQSAGISAALQSLSSHNQTGVHSTTPLGVFDTIEGLDEDFEDIPEGLPKGVQEACEAPDSEEILLADILQSEPDDPLSTEDTADLDQEKLQVQLVWELPVCVSHILLVKCHL